MSEENSPLTWVHFDGAEFKYYNPQDLREFVERESSAWDWIKNCTYAELDQWLTHVKSMITQLLAQLNSYVAQCDQSPDQAPSVMGELNSFTKNIDFPFFCTPVGRYIHEIATNDPVTAMIMVYLQVVPQNPQGKTAVVQPISKMYTALASDRNGHLNTARLKLPPYLNHANRLLAEHKAISTDKAARSYVSSLRAGQ